MPCCPILTLDTYSYRKCTNIIPPRQINVWGSVMSIWNNPNFNRLRFADQPLRNNGFYFPTTVRHFTYNFEILPFLLDIKIFNWDYIPKVSNFFYFTSKRQFFVFTSNFPTPCRNQFPHYRHHLFNRFHIPFSYSFFHREMNPIETLNIPNRVV